MCCELLIPDFLCKEDKNPQSKNIQYMDVFILVSRQLRVSFIYRVKITPLINQTLHYSIKCNRAVLAMIVYSAV